MSETLEPALPDNLDEQAERLMHRLCDANLTIAAAERPMAKPVGIRASTQSNTLRMMSSINSAAAVKAIAAASADSWCMISLRASSAIGAPAALGSSLRMAAAKLSRLTPGLGSTSIRQVPSSATKRA